MGVEGALLATGVGLSAAGMYSTVESANQQAKALKAEAALKADERAKATTGLAASQKVSFLNSGIALDGDINSTPTSVLSDTYTKGAQDIDLIGSNYNTQIKNVYSDERTQLLKQLSSLTLQGAQGMEGIGIL